MLVVSLGPEPEEQSRGKWPGLEVESQDIEGSEGDRSRGHPPFSVQHQMTGLLRDNGSPTDHY